MVQLASSVLYGIDRRQKYLDGIYDSHMQLPQSTRKHSPMLPMEPLSLDESVGQPATELRLYR